MGYTDFIVDPGVRVAYEPDIAEGLHNPVKVRTAVCRHHASMICFAWPYADQEKMPFMSGHGV